MSRIYEALQKAESERKQDPRPSFEAIEAPAAPAAVAEYEPTGYAQAEFAATLAAQSAAVRTSASGFESIARHDWNPSVDKLPSLLDRGPSVEQFRSLRSRLYELRNIRPIKSVLISSGLPQEGKSFVSANLAISLARHRNSKVLLIDGDMRRYTIHEMLGTTPSPGLADYLAGTATLDDIMQRVEQVDGQLGAAASNKAILSNLAFIPGGNGGDRAADLSGSSRSYCKRLGRCLTGSSWTRRPFFRYRMPSTWRAPAMALCLWLAAA
jgi:Mrp family chromosome partitioning ATPase